jgi:hypothetical protein
MIRQARTSRVLSPAIAQDEPGERKVEAENPRSLDGVRPTCMSKKGASHLLSTFTGSPWA